MRQHLERICIFRFQSRCSWLRQHEYGLPSTSYKGAVEYPPATGIAKSCSICVFVSRSHSVTNCLVRGLFRASYVRNVHRATVSVSASGSETKSANFQVRVPVPSVNASLNFSKYKYAYTCSEGKTFGINTEKNLFLLVYGIIKPIVSNQSENLICIRTLFMI